MIKVEEKLYVNADVFFDKIAESIAYDITASTGKNIRPKQIHKGFSYTKDMKNKMKREERSRSRLRILKLRGFTRRNSKAVRVSIQFPMKLNSWMKIISV